MHDESEPESIVPPDAGSGDEEVEPSPDFLTTLWHRLRSRRGVQLTLAYMATGYAIIRFVGQALGDNARSDAIVSTGWIIYWFGLLVVVFAIPLFLSGKHRFRSALIGGVVVSSLVAGMYLRGLMIDRAPSVTAAAPEAAPLDDVPEAPGADQGEPAPDRTASPEQAPTDPADPSTTVEAPGEGTLAMASGNAGNATPPAAPLDRLVLLFGESDSTTLDTRPVPAALFEGYQSPIPLRLYSISGDRLRLRVGDPANRTDVTLDLEVLGTMAETEMRVPTLCGTLTYRVEALRTSNETAEVTASLDRSGSQQEVDRAQALDQCRAP